MAGSPGTSEGSQQTRVVVGFEPAVVNEVMARAPSALPLEPDEVEGPREGFSYLAFLVRQERPLLRFLLRFVPKVHLVEPAAMRGELRALAREVLSKYAGGSA